MKINGADQFTRMTIIEAIKKIITCMILIVLSGCVSNTYFSSEYSKKYVLVEESLLQPCSMFTGWSDVWFSGLNDVLCIRPMRDNIADDVRILPKGTVVRIERIFKIGAVDAHYSDAEVEVTLYDGKEIEDVYIDWPSKSKLIKEAK